MALKVPSKTVEKFSKIQDIEEWKAEVFKQIDLSKIDIYLNRVLCAVYLSHHVTPGGIIVPQSNKQEDIWQGKPCLVLKVGPTAFRDSADVSFHDMSVAPGDWVTFKIGQSSQLELFDFPCRIVSDHWIESRIADPRMVTS